MPPRFLRWSGSGCNGSRLNVIGKLRCAIGMKMLVANAATVGRIVGIVAAQWFSPTVRVWLVRRIGSQTIAGDNYMKNHPFPWLRCKANGHIIVIQTTRDKFG